MSLDDVNGIHDQMMNKDENQMDSKKFKFDQPFKLVSKLRTFNMGLDKIKGIHDWQMMNIFVWSLEDAETLKAYLPIVKMKIKMSKNELEVKPCCLSWFG